MAVAAASSVRVVDAVRRVLAAITAIRIRCRVWIVFATTEFSSVIAVAVVQPWRIRSIRVVRALVGVTAAILTVWVVDAVWVISAASAVWV